MLLLQAFAAVTKARGPRDPRYGQAYDGPAGRVKNWKTRKAARFRHLLRMPPLAQPAPQLAPIAKRRTEHQGGEGRHEIDLPVVRRLPV